MLQLKAQFSYNKKQVQFLTGLHSQALQNFITSMALDWLEIYFSETIDCNQLLSTSVFKNWWLFHWYTRDDKYVITVLYKTAFASCRLAHYRAMHQNIFSTDSYDHKTLMLDFNNMFKDFQQAVKECKKVTA